MNKIVRTALGLSTAFTLSLGTAAFVSAQSEEKKLAVDLLQRGLVQGDTEFVINNVAENYIQHNPVAPDGRQGLLGFIGYLQTLEPGITVNPVRVLQEDDLVVVHSEYWMDGPKAIFDLFRIADGKIEEHWDGIQAVPEKTTSGRTMTDGPTEITDRDKTDANKELVTEFVTDVLVNGDGSKLTQYIGDQYHQHNPHVADGLEGLGNFVAYLAENDISFGYSKIHNIVAEGNFVFVQSEGVFDDQPTAFYDLFRVENSRIVEHWDTVQAIPSEMAHNNGMF